MGWFSAKSNTERDAATQFGFHVSEVMRALPEFDRANHFRALREGPCVRYALPRKAAAPEAWQLLQRHTGAENLPHGYLLEAENASPTLLQSLHTLAEAFSEEYFEFEGNNQEVAVYWEEWGGEKQVKKLYQALTPLQSL